MEQCPNRSPGYPHQYAPIIIRGQQRQQCAYCGRII